MNTTGNKDELADTMTPGELALVAASGVVDELWYNETHGDVLAAGYPPLLHYMLQGWKEGRDPGPSFSTTFYLDENPDVRRAGLNPLLHYVTQGWREGRLPRAQFKPSSAALRLVDSAPLTAELAGISDLQEAAPRPPATRSETMTVPSLSSRAWRPSASPPAAEVLRTVAFYLPQFHPIAENDAWWGKGFTEWTNVRRGTPQVEGHYQPHVPGELGYYDLRNPDVMRRQIELAQLHGVSAFCFYAYWFAGKRLLETPLDAFVNDPTLDREFCVCWANENWTRTWDGADQHLLIGQSHSIDDDISFIEQMSAYMSDHRYLRIDGKPVLLVYRPSLLPDPKATAERWRTWCRANGRGEILLAYVQSFDKVPPQVYGFDYAVEFPPNNTGPKHLPALESTPGFAGQVYDWTELAGRSRSLPPAEYPLWRGVCPTWDNTARRGERAAILWGANPDGFRDWIINAGRDTVARFAPDERLLFVNAWNEWAEGAHLEPDREYGYQWLHAVRDAQTLLAKAPLNDRGPGVVIVTHDLHQHGAQMLALALVRMLRRLGLAVEAVALGDGELRSAFEAECSITVLERDDDQRAKDVATGFVARGFITALCNTSVSGFFAEHLRAAGADVTGLVHELPSVLSDKRVSPRAGALASAAHRIWFPAQRVADEFPYEFSETCVPLIRAQGVYRGIPHRASKSAGARLRAKLDIPLDATVVLGVGFGDYRKGLDVFAAAAGCRPSTIAGSKLHFVWVGQPDVSDTRIEEALTAAGRERLHLPGFVEDPQSYYEGADVLALSSREDPYPSVTLEAMLAGLPVVAFARCTGQDDLLGRSGGTLVDSVTADELIRGLQEAIETETTGRADARSVMVKDEFNFRQYVMDILAATPSALARVTAVIPNYAYEMLISARIAEVLDQSYPIYELVVLDDASPDGSVDKIWAAIADTDVPVKFRVNETNSGSVFAQWRAGACMATGDLCWIAEADDLADRDFLEALVPFFKNQDTVMAYCQSRQIGRAGELLAPNYLGYVSGIESRDWSRRYVSDGPDEVLSCLAIKNTIPNVSAAVFRSERLRDVLVDADFGDYPTAGDWHVYVELLRAGSIAFEPLALNSHRRHVDSVIASNLGRPHLIEVMSMQARICEEFEVAPEVRLQALAYSETLLKQLGVGEYFDADVDEELSELAGRVVSPIPDIATVTVEKGAR